MNKVETVMCDAAPGRALPPVIFLKTFCGFDLFEGPGNYTIGTSSHSLVCGERPESYDRIAPYSTTSTSCEIGKMLKH